MPLVNMRDMLEHARGHGYAVAALDVTGLDFLEGVVSAAEECRAPAIVSLAEPHFGHYDFELLMAAAVAACTRSSAPLALHLDHGKSLASAVAAIRHGCNAVMVDGSHLPLSDNIALTRSVAAMAHACGAAVEGETGHVPGVEGEHGHAPDLGGETGRAPGVRGEARPNPPAEAVYTTPGEARGFVERTGADCLAVSVGTLHGRTMGRPRLDFGRLKAIAEAVDVPLVIHGGTGLGDEQIRKLIGLGVAKINVYTALAEAAAASLRQSARDPRAGHAALCRGVRAAVSAQAGRVIRLFGSSGRAAEVLANCRPWREVEHLIVFNTEVGDERAFAMMEEGRGVLGAIPGVRRVGVGRAVTQGARYRHCWLVRFASQEVIESYANHPDHKGFANAVFRPMAGDRITIDFKLW